ncbi:DUF2523 family protein [Paralysiella testudinis]|uniref:DUF2523 domain-containing protein n=1 Tax=Paralysiella testudinis TaxID=2809020 RepID=A0A892ZJC1_9NEIS|nr:DUF2523 family protein [Paralysiella testudinis]QRQ82528.1 DUF2523 domain-containing protein [Paralysiella testudinis]
MKTSIGTLLTAVLTTTAGKIMTALGVSVISYTGVSALQQQLISHITQGLGQTPPAALQLFYIAGGGVALNWILGAFAFLAGWGTAAKLGTVFNRK